MKSKLAHLLILTNGKNLRKFDAGCGKPQKDRVHLQVSIDGLQENHDFLRGKGTFQGLNESLEYLKNKGISHYPCYVS